MKKHLLLIGLFMGLLQVNAQTIYDIQGQADASPYVGESVTTKGIVTATYSSAYCIQDGDSAWTGLYVYDYSNTPSVGDSIEITGTIAEYYELTEMKNLTEFTVLSSGNDLPEPILVATGEVSEKYEAVYIKVENAICTDTDLGYGEWQVNDGSGALVVDDLGVSYTPTLNATYTITGPIYYNYEEYKLIPVTEDDIILSMEIYFTENPYPTDIEKNSLTIDFELNTAGTAELEYGLTTEYELGIAYSTASSTTQSINVSGLTPGTIYYTKTIAYKNETDQTLPHYGIFCTQSESSGTINTYFNHDRIGILTKSAFTSNIVDTIISYIEKATTSIDMAMYDVTNFASFSDSSNYKLIQAINSAYSRGVSIRVITDDEPSNAAYDSLNTAIPFAKGNTEGIMHDKFLVIDATDAANAWVVTGSTNWTYNNLFMDFNNMFCIQDQSLAKAYTLEFNEMWGSKSSTYNSLNAKFGSEKTDNTPHYFNINGTPVELYFSPSDKTTSQIVSAIGNAQDNIYFAVMAFTENSLGTAMVNAKERGVDIYGYIDYVEYSGSEYETLLNAGIEVADFANPDSTVWPDGKTLHHKFCVIDKDGDNPLVITGTHNWTASAESINDENTLFIHNADVANDYYNEYEQIYIYVNELNNSITENTITENINIYPNPSQGEVYIYIADFSNNATLRIYNSNGQLIKQQEVDEQTSTINISQKGLYFIEVLNGSEHTTKRVVIY